MYRMTHPPHVLRSDLVWPHACVGAACVSCSVGMGPGPARTRRLNSHPSDRNSGSSRDQIGDFTGLGYASNAAVAPFLTNVESHLGRVTLTAPDNIRRTNNDSRTRTQRNVSAASLRTRASVQRLRATVQPSSTAARTVRPARSMATMQHVSSPALAPVTPSASAVGSNVRMTNTTSPTPTTRQSITTDEWNRRVNVWDDIELLHNLDRTDPPPPFSSAIPNVQVHQAPAPAHEMRHVPSSPPPAFESDSEPAPEPAENDEDNSNPSGDESPELLDPAVYRERDAWERDRLLGYSLEERVLRMERRKQASELSETNLNSLRRLWETVPRDPSSTLQTVTAPAPQFVDTLGSKPDPVDDSSSEDEGPRPDEDNSDDEWESEHNALEALYQYEADMQRTLSHDRVNARRTSRHVPLSLQPGALARESRQEVRETISGSFPQEEAIETLAPANQASTVSTSSEEPLPVPHEAMSPQNTTGTSDLNSPLSLSNSVLDRPLPPPPPSRVSLIRAAYDQLYMLRRDQRVYHQFDSDIAELENYLSRYEPLHDGTEPSNPTLTHFGGAFTNPRSSEAPRPTRAHLPAITDATRHFPPAGSGPPVAKPPLPPRRGAPTIQASTNTLSLQQETPRIASEEDRPQEQGSATAHPTMNPFAAAEGPAELVPAPALQNPFLQETLVTNSLAPAAPPEPLEESAEAPTEQAPAQAVPDEEITDLDFAVAHLDDPEMRYEWASLISDYLGPAREQTQLSLQELQHISVGRVEVESRRVTSAGRVRVRLSVAGIRVERCSVCLEQFKGGQKACILPCLHMYVCNF